MKDPVRVFITIIVMLAFFMTLFFGYCKGLDYNYFDTKTLCYAFILIIVGAILVIWSLAESIKQKEILMKLIVVGLIILLSGVMLLYIYWNDNTSIVITLKHFMEDIVFNYLVSPILVVGCLYFLWIMFLRDPIRKAIGLDVNNKEVVGIVIQDDFESVDFSETDIDENKKED